MFFCPFGAKKMVHPKQTRGYLFSGVKTASHAPRNIFGFAGSYFPPQPIITLKWYSMALVTTKAISINYIEAMVYFHGIMIFESPIQP